MNPTDDHGPTNTEELLDLLVDGELSEPQRRGLLARLDETPGGWRRCALAFLEAQCWQEGLGRLRQRLEPAAAASPSVRRRLPGTRRGVLLAMAASFLVALALGVLVREAWYRGGRPGPGPDEVAAVEPPPPPAPETPSPKPAPDETPLQYVALPVSGPDGTAGSVRLPVTERQSIDDAWLRNLPEAVPDDVREAFLATGHEVRQERRVMPLRMPDGRRLVVPYDQVEIRYVGGPAYQ